MAEGTQFKTKPQLAVEMLHDLADQKQLPFRYILADSVYGTSPEFTEAAESLVGITYLLQVPEDTLGWLKQPVIADKTYRYRGKKKTKKIPSDTAKVPVTFKVLVKGINNFFWYRRKVSEGTKGPIEYEFTKRRVSSLTMGCPQKQYG